jgi:hypothetical protein
MRKKYDELVSYTVNLTAERDRLKTVSSHPHTQARACDVSISIL